MTLNPDLIRSRCGEIEESVKRLERIKTTWPICVRFVRRSFVSFETALREVELAKKNR